MTRRGKLVLVVAPSGSGKDTLMEAAEAAFPDLETLVTCTTREPRAGEVQDVDYHFFTREVFDNKIAQGEFLEWAEYGGNVYGTLKASIEEVIARGELLLATIEVQGARRVRELLPPAELATIYIEAGGWDVLARRIQSRAQMSPEELAKRHERYLDEVTFKEEADYVVENPDGGREEAAQQFVKVIADIKNTLAQS
jgi:guanylate kinase